MFYFENINGKRILKSDFIKDAEAFFTTRDLCICDKGVNDNKHSAEIEILNQVQNDIKNNQKTLCDYLKISENNLISPDQTHSANIDIVKPSTYNYPDCDGLILTKKNMAIFLNFADCTPIILYDEKQKIGAIAHAGWRGTAQKIAPLTVEKMGKFYGTNPKDIIALIGPAIGFCCYNVGQEVYEKLSKTIDNFDGLYKIKPPPLPLPLGEGSLNSLKKTPQQVNSYYVDLKNINKQQLIEIGVEKIDVCPYCTVHNNDLFFSYRNENATTKRHSAVLKLGE